MGIVTSTLKTLFPRGEAWRFPVKFRSVRDALSLQLDTVKVFLEEVITESNPGTAEDTLPEWYDQLNIRYDDTRSVRSLQERANQIYSAIGGQSKEYIEGQIQTAYPDAYIDEYNVPYTSMVGLGMVGLMQVGSYPVWYAGDMDGEFPVYSYFVRGEVDDIQDLLNIQNLLSRIAPATHHPVYQVTIRNQTETAEVGLAMAGLAQVGRTKEDI